MLVEHVSALDPHALEALAPLANPELEAAVLNQIISKESLLMATNDIFWLSGCFFVALMLLVWLSQPPQGGINAATGTDAH